METMEQKYEQCKNCLAYEQEWKTECEACKDGSGLITIEDFLADIEDDPPKENELKYFPIRWLIRLMLKYLNEDGTPTWFNGIAIRPFGDKTKDDVFPLWLHVFFPIVYVNQWRDGGYTGDDFAGDLYYRLLPFVWLRFGYEC